jgi:hypothetical protein
VLSAVRGVFKELIQLLPPDCGDELWYFGDAVVEAG